MTEAPFELCSLRADLQLGAESQHLRVPPHPGANGPLRSARMRQLRPPAWPHLHHPGPQSGGGRVHWWVVADRLYIALFSALEQHRRVVADRFYIALFFALEQYRWVVVDPFYTALFSALEQTHCVRM